jgi:hypothetical protein
VLALLEKLVLKFQALVIGFDGPDRADYRVDPALNVGFALLLCGGAAVAGVMIGEACVPPDRRVALLYACNAVGMV